MPRISFIDLQIKQRITQLLNTIHQLICICLQKQIGRYFQTKQFVLDLMVQIFMRYHKVEENLFEVNQVLGLVVHLILIIQVGGITIDEILRYHPLQEQLILP